MSGRSKGILRISALLSACTGHSANDVSMELEKPVLAGGIQNCALTTLNSLFEQEAADTLSIPDHSSDPQSSDQLPHICRAGESPLGSLNDGELLQALQHQLSELLGGHFGQSTEQTTPARREESEENRKGGSIGSDNCPIPSVSIMYRSTKGSLHPRDSLQYSNSRDAGVQAQAAGGQERQAPHAIDEIGELPESMDHGVPTKDEPASADPKTFWKVWSSPALGYLECDFGWETSRLYSGLLLCICRSCRGKVE